MKSMEPRGVAGGVGARGMPLPAQAAASQTLITGNFKLRARSGADEDSSTFLKFKGFHGLGSFHQLSSCHVTAAASSEKYFKLGEGVTTDP